MRLVCCLLLALLIVGMLVGFVGCGLAGVALVALGYFVGRAQSAADPLDVSN